MVRHNNVIPDEHFRKKWDMRVKTWLHQPIQKKIRREKRKIRAAEISPRPTAGSLRPLVHAPTRKYNAKVRLGRGFTLEELKEAGIHPQFAKSVGIAVDHRRTNKSAESLTLNVERLKQYKERLVIFPRRNSRKSKSGDATTDERASARQLRGPIIAKPSSSPAVTVTQLTEELTGFKAYASLRASRNESRLVGVREKKAKEAKDTPAKATDE